MTISFKQIRYFVATAESGQVSHAAVALNVSQSAVTSAIKQLEADLGVDLFRRLSNGMALTPEGTRFLDHARNIMVAMEAALRSPLTDDRTLTGTVRVGVTYTVCGYFYPRHYTRFARTHPNITIDLCELPRREIEAQLRSGDLDLAVMLVSNLQDHETIATELLLRSQRRLWLPVEHPLLARETITFADVAAEPYVMLTVDEADKTTLRYWEPHGLEPRCIVRTSSVEAVRSMVADGVGVTILSDMVYRPWSLEGKRLEQRKVEAVIPSMDVGLAWNRARAHAPATRALLDYFSLAFGTGGIA